MDYRSLHTQLHRLPEEVAVVAVRPGPQTNWGWWLLVRRGPGAPPPPTPDHWGP